MLTVDFLVVVDVICISLLQDHAQLKRKHGSTTNHHEEDAEEDLRSKWTLDDNHDDSFITTATKEGSLHLSELSLVNMDNRCQNVAHENTASESEECVTSSGTSSGECSG